MSLKVLGSTVLSSLLWLSLASAQQAPAPQLTQPPPTAPCEVQLTTWQRDAVNFMAQAINSTAVITTLQGENQTLTKQLTEARKEIERLAPKKEDAKEKGTN